jgi:hypothetical protein
MNKAPNKIWYNFEYHKMIISGMDNDDVPYIRADLVEELASLLKEWNNATAEEDKNWFDYESRVNAALNAMEEENGN